MKLDPNLKEMGVDEDLIKLLHSKTKLKHREIEDANLIKSCDNKYLVQLRLKSQSEYNQSSRLMVLNIDKDRIREMKLKMIFN
jgi:hypothetical protein